MRTGERFGYLMLCVLGSAACSETIQGAATRYVDPALAHRPATPVCFAPAPAALGLAERGQYEAALAGCKQGALAEGVQVSSAQDCWHVDVQWTTEFSGRAEVDCSPVGWDCDASNIFRKGARVRVTDPTNGKVMIDTLAAISSPSRQFEANTAFALCSAAFRDYPAAELHRTMTIDLP